MIFPQARFLFGLWAFQLKVNGGKLSLATLLENSDNIPKNF